MAHRNSPDPTTGVSPAHIVFGRDIRDIIPQSSYAPAAPWTEIAKLREASFMKRHFLKAEQDKGVPSSPLHVGDHVYLQNQAGYSPNKWTKSGVVVEKLPHDAFTVKIDGSNAVTKRNRRFLRRFIPFSSHLSQTTTAAELVHDTMNSSPSTPLHDVELPEISSCSCYPYEFQDLVDHPLTVASVKNDLIQSPASNVLPPDSKSSQGASGIPGHTSDDRARNPKQP